MNYYLKALRNYTNLKGRARRNEYWFFFLFNIIFGFVATGIDILLNLTFEFDSSEVMAAQYGYVYLIYFFAMIIPGLAVAVRRLHDTGKSGVFLLVILIPLIGLIWLLVLLFTDSDYGENKYGPNPKGLGNNDEIDEIGSLMPA